MKIYILCIIFAPFLEQICLKCTVQFILVFSGEIKPTRMMCSQKLTETVKYDTLCIKALHTAQERSPRNYMPCSQIFGGS